MDSRISARNHQPVTDIARQPQNRANTTGRAGGDNRASGARQTGEVDQARERNIGQLTELLRKSFPGGEGMAELIHSRATELHEMGYDRDRTQAVIQKGLKMDRITSAAAGAITTLSFAVSAFPAEAVSKGATTLFGTQAGALSSDIIGGVMGGGGAMVLKAYSDKILANAVKDSKWMEADKAMLDPAMHAMVERREGLGQSMKQALVGGQGFNARNVVTGIAATLGANLPESERLKLNTAMSTILTPAAGALSGVLTNGTNSLHGPEFLFGRTDWRERFEQLDNTSVNEQMYEGTKKRLQTALVDSLASPRQVTKGLTNLLSGPMVAEIMTLGSGLGGVNGLRHTAREGMQDSNLNAMSQQALEQTVNLIAAGAAYALQGIAGTMAGPASTRNDDAIDAFFDKHSMLEPANWVRSNNRESVRPEEGNGTDQTHNLPLTGIPPRDTVRPQPLATPEVTNTVTPQTQTQAAVTHTVAPQTQTQAAVTNTVAPQTETQAAVFDSDQESVHSQETIYEDALQEQPTESASQRNSSSEPRTSNEFQARQIEHRLNSGSA